MRNASNDGSPLLPSPELSPPAKSLSPRLALRRFTNRLTFVSTSRTLQIFLLVITLSLSLFLFSYLTSDALTVYNANSSGVYRPAKNSSRKLVMYWTPWFDKAYARMYGGEGNAPFVKHCPSQPGDVYSRCEATDDRSRVAEADAVVFHIPDLINPVNIFGGVNVPSVRTPDQRYVFYDLESPVHSLTRLSKFGNFFNWTISYRRDSDIYAPYARFNKNQDSETNLNLTVAPSSPGHLVALSNKTGWVGWVVSRCFTHSRRESYVNQLKRHIDVDIWGRCGQGKCDDKCFNRIARQYRFYVSIENSLCTDYVTEKFFSRISDLDAVLIVLQAPGASGTTTDNYAHIAPPNSFIDASKFESPAKLAEYLKRVGSSPAEFAKFFEWRHKYSVEGVRFQAMCELCRRLHDPNEPPKVYADIEKWWAGDLTNPHCHAGSVFSSDGKKKAPRPYHTPYFIHIQN